LDCLSSRFNSARGELPLEAKRSYIGVAETLDVRRTGVAPNMSRPNITRGEDTELADRLWGLINMIDAGEMSATTGMTYRLQGAVTALDAVMRGTVEAGQGVPGEHSSVGGHD
jgi:hypothetical protein